MERFAAARINLLRLKNEVVTLKNGVRLLRSRREALMKDFFRCAGECLELRAKINSQLREAAYKLHIARAFLGDAIYPAAYALKRDISVDVRIKNVWGVNIPEIEEKAFVRNIEAMEFSPIGEGTLAIEAARDFEKVVDSIVSAASREIRLKRIGEEIKTDTRRINAHEEILIPYMQYNIKRIKGILEEREREDIYRLKRYKRRKTKL